MPDTANIETTEISNISFGPKYLWFLMVAYTVMLFGADWFDARHIKIFGLVTAAGSITFPLTYLLADIITEVYGYKNTRLAIWAGFLFYAAFLFFGQIFVYFTDPASVNKEALSLFFRINDQIILASFAAYLTAESTNSYLIAKLKIFLKGQYIAFRFIISTLLAYFIDVVVYVPLAFHGMMHFNDFIQNAIDSWIFMVSIELLLLPLSIRLTKYIKKSEKLDIYDNRTKFNIFNLNTEYSSQDNHYMENKAHESKNNN
ncbi:MAG: queuosine precursor transporter [Gammaproteobacteria bacterium]